MAAEMMNVLPATYGGLVNILLAFIFGVLALVTGLSYLRVASRGVYPVIAAEGLSVAEDPVTGVREWIELDDILAATLRPWSMSPWFRAARYFELDLELKEGAVHTEDRFYVHLGDEEEQFARKLESSLGDRFRRLSHA